MQAENLHQAMINSGFCSFCRFGLILRSLLTALMVAGSIMPGARGEDAPQLPVPTDEQLAKIAACLPAKPMGVGRPINDRQAWAAAAKLPAFQQQLKDAEEYSTDPIPKLDTDELFAQVVATGKREIYEKPFRRRTTRLVAFTIAECVRNDGTYLPLIEKEVQAILSEKTWSNSFQKEESLYGGLDGTIDLASSIRAWNLATVDYWLGDKLQPQTRAKIRGEVKRRIFDNYEKAVKTGQPLWWWMKGRSNWNAVCNSGVLGTALTLIESPQERALFVQGALNSMPYYLNSLGEDGYCEEGVGYWAYGFGCYLVLAETLYQQTQGKVNLYQGHKPRQVALFMSRFEIVPQVYPAFGDAWARWRGGPESLMWLIDQRWGMNWDIDMNKSDMYAKHPLGDRLPGFGIFGFPLPKFGDSLMAGSPPEADDSLEKDRNKRTFYRDENMLICRSLTAGRQPFGIALKGGNNGMAHGHNDNGSYVVAVGKVPLVLDPGMEIYTTKSFGPHRFESMMNNSYGHDVPYVGRTLQKSGKEATARIIETEFTDERDTLKMDLTGSYDVPALKKLVRTYVFNRVNPALEVIDEVEFSAPTDYGSALVTLSGWKENGSGSFLIYEGDSALKATVTVSKGDAQIKNQVEPITGFQLPPNFNPTRLGLNLDRPVTQVTMHVLLEPVTVQAKP